MIFRAMRLLKTLMAKLTASPMPLALSDEEAKDDVNLPPSSSLLSDESPSEELPPSSLLPSNEPVPDARPSVWLPECSLLVSSSELKGPSLTNPSIYNDNGKILVNLRNINYTLYHSEKKKYEHPWGPLVYIHPENDVRLRTWNIMCEMDENMRVKSYHHIDTSKFPDKELWEFGTSLMSGYYTVFKNNDTAN